MFYEQMFYTIYDDDDEKMIMMLFVDDLSSLAKQSFILYCFLSDVNLIATQLLDCFEAKACYEAAPEQNANYEPSHFFHLLLHLEKTQW